MKVSRSDYLKRAFVLDKKNAVKIYNSQARFIRGCKNETLEISILCSDGLRRHFASVGDLLRFENSKKAIIKEVCFSSSGFCDDELNRSELILKDNEDNSVILYINGSEERAVELNNELEDRISSMKPWFSPIAEMDITKVFVGGFIVVMLMLLAFIVVGHLFGLLTLQTDANYVSGSLSVGVGIVGGAIFTLICILMSKISNIVFPVASFCIGQGEKRYENMNLIRNTVVIGLAVSIVGSVLVSIFF